jgi:hypothetical protein
VLRGLLLGTLLITGTLLVTLAGTPVHLGYDDTAGVPEAIGPGNGYVAVRPTAIAPGDVVVFRAENGDYLARRVVEVGEETVTVERTATRPDGETVTESVPTWRVAAKVAVVGGRLAVVPGFGAVVPLLRAAQTALPVALLLLVVAVGLAVRQRRTGSSRSRSRDRRPRRHSERARSGDIQRGQGRDRRRAGSPGRRGGSREQGSRSREQADTRSQERVDGQQSGVDPARHGGSSGGRSDVAGGSNGGRSGVAGGSSDGRSGVAGGSGVVRIGGWLPVSPATVFRVIVVLGVIATGGVTAVGQTTFDVTAPPDAGTSDEEPQRVTLTATTPVVPTAYLQYVTETERARVVETSEAVSTVTVAVVVDRRADEVTRGTVTLVPYLAVLPPDLLVRLHSVHPVVAVGGTALALFGPLVAVFWLVVRAERLVNEVIHSE